jgi:hypothetical protein
MLAKIWSVIRFERSPLTIDVRKQLDRLLPTLIALVTGTPIMASSDVSNPSSAFFVMPPDVPSVASLPSSMQSNWKWWNRLGGQRLRVGDPLMAFHSQWNVFDPVSNTSKPFTAPAPLSELLSSSSSSSKNIPRHHPLDRFLIDYAALYERIAPSKNSSAVHLSFSNHMIAVYPAAQLANRLRITTFAFILGILLHKPVYVDFNYYASAADVLEMALNFGDDRLRQLATSAPSPFEMGLEDALCRDWQTLSAEGKQAVVMKVCFS